MRPMIRMPYLAALLVAVIVIGAIPAWAQFPGPAPQQPQQPVQQQPQPAQPQPPQPALDPRVDRVKGGLQQQGYRVLDAGFMPQSASNSTPLWFATVAAQYAQPSAGPILKHAFDTWNVLIGVAGQEPPQTGMVSDQFWTKYSIMMITSVGRYNDLANKFRAASTQQEKEQIFQQFLPTIVFRVWDHERRQLVDQQDFVNKNFAR